MWILTTANGLVNTSQVTSITVEAITDLEYPSEGGATKVKKKALIAGLSDSKTCVLVSFAADASSEGINVYMDAIKQGLATDVSLCDLTSL